MRYIQQPIGALSRSQLKLNADRLSAREVGGVQRFHLAFEFPNCEFGKKFTLVELTSGCFECVPVRSTSTLFVACGLRWRR
jgi:hypothetical protein